MSKRMLIDANHPEETRVVVLDGSKVEEFDFEAASKRPLKGNIYLAKVTRVEPSLQAAFVEYGGNRQGFLAFSEIHPDYYQIPVADRQALLAEQEAEARRRQEDDIESFEMGSGAKLEGDDEEEEETGEESPRMATTPPLCPWMPPALKRPAKASRLAQADADDAAREAIEEPHMAMTTTMKRSSSIMADPSGARSRTRKKTTIPTKSEAARIEEADYGQDPGSRRQPKRPRKMKARSSR